MGTIIVVVNFPMFVAIRYYKNAKLFLIMIENSGSHFTTKLTVDEEIISHILSVSCVLWIPEFCWLVAGCLGCCVVYVNVDVDVNAAHIFYKNEGQLAEPI